MSPIMYEQNADLDTGKYNTRIKSVAELSNAELVEHIETLKQIAAEDFSIYIEDPNLIIWTNDNNINENGWNKATVVYRLHVQFK